MNKPICVAPIYRFGTRNYCQNPAKFDENNAGVPIHCGVHSQATRVRRQETREKRWDEENAARRVKTARRAGRQDVLMHARDLWLALLGAGLIEGPVPMPKYAQEAHTKLGEALKKAGIR